MNTGCCLIQRANQGYAMQPWHHSSDCRNYRPLEVTPDLHGHATTVNANGSCKVTCACGKRTGGHRTEEFALRELRRHLVRHGALIVVRSSMTGQTRDIPVHSRTVQLVRPTPSS